MLVLQHLDMLFFQKSLLKRCLKVEFWVKTSGVDMESSRAEAGLIMPVTGEMLTFVCFLCQLS